MVSFKNFLLDIADFLGCISISFMVALITAVAFYNGISLFDVISHKDLAICSVVVGGVIWLPLFSIMDDHLFKHRMSKKYAPRKW